ncbi:MAG: GDSL-type esterase/lipase family protein [Gemmatimonadaceae bacterium]
MGVLVAEGDSWFDYPGLDVLNSLEDNHGYDVETVAHAGDRVEDMAYGGSQLLDFRRRLEKVLRSGRVPRAILLSGGGNDIAGDEFAVLLDHKGSVFAGINDDIARAVIEQRIKFSYITIVAEITRICEEIIGSKVPVVTHGYDYPIPDGRGYKWGFLTFAGPWLQPGFHQKGFRNQKENAALMVELMDRFNAMMASLKGVPSLGHVRHVDLRGVLSASPSNYEKYWDNELHPTKRGFELVALKFQETLAKLP